MNCLSPSILSADFTRLGDQIREMDEAGAKYVHIDVMDGLFVPQISIGLPVLKSIRPITEKVLDVHLMIEDPDRYIEDFVKAGADIVTVHAEAARHLDRTIAKIKEAGAMAGVALNPATPLSVLDYVLPECDMVLIMSVNPGFGGQKFIPYTIEKLLSLKKIIKSHSLSTDVEVDGGVNLENASRILDAGANILVAGSAVFSNETGSITDNVRAFLKLLE